MTTLQFPFDEVHVLRHGEVEKLDGRRFLAIPIYERIQLMMEQKLSFFRSGSQLEARAALKELRLYTAKQSAQKQKD